MQGAFDFFVAGPEPNLVLGLSGDRELIHFEAALHRPTVGNGGQGLLVTGNALQALNDAAIEVSV